MSASRYNSPDPNEALGKTVQLEAHLTSHVSESTKTEDLNAYELRMALSRGTPLARAPKSSELHTAALVSPQDIEGMQVRHEQSAPLSVQRAESAALLGTSTDVPRIRRPVTGDTTSYDAAALRRALSGLQGFQNAAPQQLDLVPLASTPPKTTAAAAASETPGSQCSNASLTGNVSRKLSLLEQLGLLTKRYPLGVLGGAALGAIFIAVFSIGAAHLLGAGSKTASAMPQSRAGQGTAGSVDVRPTKADSRKETEPVSLSAGASTPAKTEDLEPVNDPAVAVASGHLYAGRLAEAETAYADLGRRHPEVPAYTVLARVLGRRNSAECRSTADAKKLCPMVKQ